MNPSPHWKPGVQGRRDNAAPLVVIGKASVSADITTARASCGRKTTSPDETSGAPSDNGVLPGALTVHPLMR